MLLKTVRIKKVNERVKKLDGCTEKTTEDEKFREEEGVEIFFVNKNNEELKIIKIDDCVVTGNTHKRCDFMVQHGIINYYIELKNKGWKRAVEQIASAINLLNKDCFDGKKCQAIIVLANQASKVKIIQAATDELVRLVEEADVCCPIIIRNTPYDLPLS